MQDLGDALQRPSRRAGRPSLDTADVYHFYREPDGPFVFVPWGADDTFHLKDDPNPFDNISNPPPSVLALTAIPNRLYNDGDWRIEYVTRLKGLLDTVWDEEELLAVVDEMAATVQRHALEEAREAAAADTERVRKFILKRRGEILADLTPAPPDWPEPEAYDPPPAGSETLEITFETTWGSNLSPNPLGAGTIDSLLLNGSEESVEGMGTFADHSSPEERVLLPEVDKPASIVVAGLDDDGTVTGMTLAVDLDLLAAGATLVIGAARRHRRFPNRGQPHPGRRQPALENKRLPAEGRCPLIGGCWSELLDRVMVGHGRVGRAEQHLGAEVPLVEEPHELGVVFAGGVGEDEGFELGLAVAPVVRASTVA